MANLMRLRSCCDRLQSDVHAQVNLGETEFGFVAAFPADTPTSAGSLCRAVGLSPSRGSRVIDGLVRKGIIERQPDAHDRRISLLELTPVGREIQEHLKTCVDSCEHSLASQLTGEELVAVEEAIALLLRVIDSVHPASDP